ncbi:Histone-lysine n-methyltransferase suvr4 [Thalictrum thalictroides]|uniref:Histone-lysine n-methyltransferase suvr4 n=1 Tax=Thalictrum thalictroides TaxID=46969 RepID=A0A7J6W0Y6_THATH|nr:Histone-lysine n-methyltransferase suvr4 [Thalictrum thalictroides]
MNTKEEIEDPQHHLIKAKLLPSSRSAMTTTPNPRVVKAIDAMKDLGIPEVTTKPVLKNLYKVFNKKWEFIEAENYRVLADAIFEYQDDQVDEAKKRKDTQRSGDVEPQSKRLNLMQNEDRTAGCSQLVFGSKLNEHNLTQTFARGNIDELKPGSHSIHSNERGKDKVNASWLQSYSMQDIACASNDRKRDKEKQTFSCRNALRENEAIPKRVSIGLSFKEPKVERSEVTICNDGRYNAVTRHQCEPFISDECQFEKPIAMVRPLIRYHAKEDREDGGDGTSVTGHNTGLCVKIENKSESCFSNFEITSTPSGEVKISLSCISSTGRPDIRMPSLDAVLKLAGDRCLKTHKIINPSISLIDLMEELCQHFLRLSTIPTSAVNMDSRALIVYQGIHEGRDHMADSSSNGWGNGQHFMQAERKSLECNGGRSKRKDQDGLNSSTSGSLMVVPHFNLDSVRPPHDLEDIGKGEEKVKILVVNEINDMHPPFFHYIAQNNVYQDAHVNFSLARIGDEDSCSNCFGDCLSSPIICACTRETGGEFAYTADGNLKGRFLDEYITMIRNLPNDRLYYCEDCPLERSKSGNEKCKGHLVRKFIKECWTKCGCNKICGNRVVQRGITQDLQVFLTPEGKGWGLRTVKSLPKGAFVCEYVGEILTNIELYQRNEKSTGNEKHTYPVLLDADWSSEGILDEEALCLDATTYGNVARFINHRCYDANLVEIPVEIETPDHHYYHVAFFTSRPVGAMEELTWDYGLDFLDVNHPIKAFRCRCGSIYCRGMPLANGWFLSLGALTDVQGLDECFDARVATNFGTGY